MSSPHRALAPALIVVTLAAAPAAAADAPAPAAAATPGPAGTWLFLPRGNRLVASSLSLGLNGLGQVYNGETEKGLGMMSGWLAYPLAWGLDSLTGGSYVRLFAFTANMGIKAWSVTDAWQMAAPPTPPPAGPPPPPPPPRTPRHPVPPPPTPPPTPPATPPKQP